MRNDSRKLSTILNGGAQHNVWLHRFAIFTAIATFGLIFVGGLVTSHDAGLSVPDWPNTYGQFMFSFPYSQWVGNIFYEHSHRLMASLVGFLITVEAIWLQFAESRSWVKRLGWFALAGVVAQGILGGLTVIFFLPPAISSSHAGLAQTVLCICTSIALVTSRHWEGAIPSQQIQDNAGVRGLGLLTVGVIFTQLMIGAVMRHTGSGLAIPTFPLAFGRLIPEFSSFGIAINFAHRVGAVVVSALVLTTSFRTYKAFHSITELRRPAILAAVLLLFQITLGAITILTEKAVTPTTLHVSCGAALLATMLVLTIRARHLLTAVEQESEATTSANSIVHDPALS